MDKIWAVNGLFYAQRLSGIQRYSSELLRELDELISPGRVEVVLPPDAPAPVFHNINAVRFSSYPLCPVCPSGIHHSVG